MVAALPFLVVRACLGRSKTAPLRTSFPPVTPVGANPLSRGLTKDCPTGLVSPFSNLAIVPPNSVMALKIRLTRIGTTHQPHYRVVVAEARSRRDGAPVETLGSYDPRAKGRTLTIDLARVDYWLSKGAQPSDTLHAMIKKFRRAAAATASAAVAAPAATA